MKQFIYNLGLFIVFCIAFSSLEGCTGNEAKSAVNNTSTAGANNASAKFPAIPAALAASEIEMLDGSKSKIGDHKGKVLMLNLWGIWCGPCRDEMPHLAQFQHQYADKGLEVISANIGDHDGHPENVDNIKKFATDMKIDYTLVRIAPEAVGQFYLLTKQQVVPQTILIDRVGHLRGVFVGGGQHIFETMQETLDKTMNE